MNFEGQTHFGVNQVDSEKIFKGSGCIKSEIRYDDWEICPDFFKFLNQ